MIKRTESVFLSEVMSFIYQWLLVIKNYAVGVSFESLDFSNAVDVETPF